MAIDIVDIPIEQRVIFHSLVSLQEGSRVIELFMADVFSESHLPLDQHV